MAGGGRLAVPDLIKEILTGSGESEVQVGCEVAPEITKLTDKVEEELGGEGRQ